MVLYLNAEWYLLLAHEIHFSLLWEEFFKKSHHVFPQQMMEHDGNEEISYGRRLPVHEEDEVGVLMMWILWILEDHPKTCGSWVKNHDFNGFPKQGCGTRSKQSTWFFRNGVAYHLTRMILQVVAIVWKVSWVKKYGPMMSISRFIDFLFVKAFQ